MDGIGNVSLLTDRLGEPEARYRYDAFGGLLTSATAPYNLYGPFGKEFDPVSGLVYFGARWYDAAVGRFITPDPVAGTIRDPLSLNPYVFALANPVNFVDRWGLHPEDPVYIITEGPDFFEVYLKYLVGQADMYTIQEVSRTPEEIVLKHTYRHYHQYFIWEFRRELRLREDGSEYWEWVRDEEYVTDWVLVGEYSWREVIDLVAYKQDILLREGGPAPASAAERSWFDAGTGGGEWSVSLLFYSESFPEEQFPAGSGVEPQERLGPLEQPEVVSPPFTTALDTMEGPALRRS